jgi:hypothetical protein
VIRHQGSRFNCPETPISFPRPVINFTTSKSPFTNQTTHSNPTPLIHDGASNASYYPLQLAISHPSSARRRKPLQLLRRAPLQRPAKCHGPMSGLREFPLSPITHSLHQRCRFASGILNANSTSTAKTSTTATPTSKHATRAAFVSPCDAFIAREMVSSPHGVNGRPRTDMAIVRRQIRRLGG